MAGEGGYGGVLDGGVSRARFLKLAGLGAGISFFPGSLFPANAAQAVGVPEILDPTRYPYPIAAWWPPPPVENTGTKEAQQENTNALYADLAVAGFNTVIGGNGVSNIRANNLALKACAVNGLRLVLDDSFLRNNIDPPPNTGRSAGQEEPESVMQALAEQDSQRDVGARAVSDRQAAITDRLEELKRELLKDEPLKDQHYSALAGILLDDEPGKSLFPILKFAKAQVREVFGEDELPYVNVWPSHAHPSALEAKSYTDYLDRYMNRKRYPNAVAPPFLSFDHYPLLADGRTTPDFFYNHAVIRNFAKRFGVSSWAFVQSVGFDGSNVGLGVRRRPPVEADIFWQINVALAYGVKGIQYFTYWTPNDPDVEFEKALVGPDGNPTERYGYAREANEFLRKVGGILLPLTSVSHFGGEEPAARRPALPGEQFRQGGLRGCRHLRPVRQTQRRHRTVPARCEPLAQQGGDDATDDLRHRRHRRGVRPFRGRGGRVQVRHPRREPPGPHRHHEPWQGDSVPLAHRPTEGTFRAPGFGCGPCRSSECPSACQLAASRKRRSRARSSLVKPLSTGRISST